MEFIDLDIDVPDIFRDILSRVKTIESSSGLTVIAGGAPCNHYLGRSFRDVDVFVDYDITEESLHRAFQCEVDVTIRQVYRPYNGWKSIPEHFKVHYKGYDIDIIPTYRDRIIDFDLRFRQFYFLGDRIFASKEALLDIEKRELVVVNPNSGYSAFTRVIRFQYEFDFTISDFSLQYLKWYLQFEKFNAKSFLDRVDEDPKLNSHVRQLIRNAINQENQEDAYLFKGTPFPFHPSLENRLKSLLMEGRSIGISYSSFLHYEPIAPMELSIRLEYKHLENSIKKLDGLVRSSRLEALFNVPNCNIPSIKKQDLATKWQEYFECDVSYQLNNLEFMRGSRAPYSGIFPVTITENTEEFCSVNDSLLGNSMILQVNDMTFYLRKCSNGKYTIAGIANDQVLQGSGFFLEAIGSALKEQHPLLFDFYNADLLGVYAYNHPCHFFEHFFYTPVNSSILIDRQKNYLAPIRQDKIKKTR